MTPASPPDAVLDASAFLRGLPHTGNDLSAARWLGAIVRGERLGIVPEFVFLEVANALATSVRARRLTASQARRVLGVAFRVPVEVFELRRLVAPALDLALQRELSVYDASYVYIAEKTGAVLVTADRRLASAVRRSALLPETGPEDV